MCGVSPKIVDPDLEIEPETITPMYDGNGPLGGGVLLPGSVLQFVRHAAGLALSSKPLNEDGAPPPLSVLSCGPLRTPGT